MNLSACLASGLQTSPSWLALPFVALLAAIAGDAIRGSPLVGATLCQGERAARHGVRGLLPVLVAKPGPPVARGARVREFHRSGWFAVLSWLVASMCGCVAGATPLAKLRHLTPWCRAGKTWSARPAASMLLIRPYLRLNRERAAAVSRRLFHLHRQQRGVAA